MIEGRQKERWERERDRWQENVQLLRERARENEAAANSEPTNTTNSERQTERERRRERQWEDMHRWEIERDRQRWRQSMQMIREATREAARERGEPTRNSEPTNNTNTQRNSERQTERERRREQERQRMEAIYRGQPGPIGGSKTKLSKSDLKLKLALEADNPKFKKYARRSLSPSGKSPRQKYIGCDLNSNDPITQETLGDLHFKKIKYLSKIKTTLPDGKIVTNCYDTIPFYNYILDCNNKGERPLNLAIGKVPLTLTQKAEVFKKIKFFTKQPTLELNIDTTKKYFLKANYIHSSYSNNHYTTYELRAQINIGSIDFYIRNNNFMRYFSGVPKVLHEGPIISRDDMLFEDTSDETVLLIQKGMENGSLLKVNTYPYWNSNYSSEGNMPYNYKLLELPPFTFSRDDSIQELEERTKVFNNRLRRLI